LLTIKLRLETEAKEKLEEELDEERGGQVIN
jgi:hypothetical protein